MESIPYTPQNAEAFFRQLEQRNNADEYTKCIEALEAISEGERGYQLKLLPGRRFSQCRSLVTFHGFGFGRQMGVVPVKDCKKRRYLGTVLWCLMYRYVFSQARACPNRNDAHLAELFPHPVKSNAPFHTRRHPC